MSKELSTPALIGLCNGKDAPVAPKIIMPDEFGIMDNAQAVDEFHDSQHSLEWDHELGRPVAVRGEQEVPEHALRELRELRTGSGNRREGEFMKVASIPVVVVDKWAREGFDVFKATAKEIVAKLQSEDMGYFMATSKSL